MEIIIAVVVIAGFAFFLFQRFDANKDGKVTLDEVKTVADVNNDGKVDVEDVKVAVTKAKTAVKKTLSGAGAKTRAIVGKAVVKKPAVKKATTVKKPAAKKAAK